jgi:hypothetical protein
MKWHVGPSLLLFRGMPETGLGCCPPNSVDKFKELSKIFLTKFLAFRTQKKPLGYLIILHQHSNETLKEFMAWFNQEKIMVENPTDDMVFAAIYHGISPKEPLMKKLARKQPSTL